MKSVVLAIGIAVIAMVPAQAASFNCRAARGHVEEWICDTKELSRLDEDMAKAYAEAKARADDLVALQESQRRWLKAREDCYDISALAIAYRAHIQLLKGGLDAERTLAERREEFCEVTDQSPSVLNKLREKFRPVPGWNFATAPNSDPPPIGFDNPMCQELKLYMERVAPKWEEWPPNSKDARWNRCVRSALLFPGFTEPPWTDLDPRQYEQLVVELFRFHGEGGAGYFGKYGMPPLHGDAHYIEKAKGFIAAGGRVQYWKTRLFEYLTGLDLVYRQTEPGEQHVIQLRYSTTWVAPEDSCPEPDWSGAIFLANEELTGPLRTHGAEAEAMVNLRAYHGNVVSVDYSEKSTVHVVGKNQYGGLTELCRLDFHRKSK